MDQDRDEDRDEDRGGAAPKTEIGRSPGYIPRPPSAADVAKVSGQQGMIADEWAPEPGPQPAPRSPTEDTPEEDDTKGQPG
jgi:hypothetical protein